MNKIKAVIRHILSFLARLALLRNLKVCHTGKGSRVNFWRIRPSRGGVFKVGEKSLVRADMVYE
ncbi:MAG: hypothetical protein ABL925_20300, partial [Methylococcales bacterium]